MSRNVSAIAVALSMLPFGQPLLVGTLGISTATTAAVLQQSAAVAQDASVARIAAAITVRIEGSTQGSGVIVQREGNRYTVLTAWHVVSGNRPGEEVGIYTPDGKQHQLQQGSIQRLGEVDMAVLSFTSGSSYEVAEVGDIKKVKYGQPIYVAGFPFNNSQNLRYETGEVVANAEIGIDQGYQLLYDNKTESGMSGGVLLNSDGGLVGLHGRGERDEQAYSDKELVTKTGINQGIPITYYKLFANGEPVMIIKNAATSVDDYLAQAKASQTRKGREQTVIKLTNQALALRPSFEGYFLRAYAKYDLNKYQEAIADYTKSIEINPQKPVSYNNRGNAKQKSKDYQGAIADFNKAIAMNPKYAPAYMNRGIVKYDLEDYQGAIADYNKAIAINPKYPIAFNNRGNAKAELGDNKEAITDFNRAIAINSRYADAFSNRGISKYELKDYQGAMADYNKAIEINPQFGRAYSNRGILKRSLGNYQGAISDYTKAIEIDRRDAAAFSNRAFAKIYSGDYQGAINDASKAILINPKYAIAYNNRGWSKFKQGDFRGALRDANKALALNPNNGATLDTRGRAKHKLGQNKSACNDLRKASSLGYTGASEYLKSREGAWCNNM